MTTAASSRAAGILLKPSSILSSSTSSPASSTSSSHTSLSDMATTMPPVVAHPAYPHKSATKPASTSSRRIRFAPLPDPRRAVVITDDGYELPIADDTHFPAAASLAILEQCANGNFPPLSQGGSESSSVVDPPAGDAAAATGNAGPHRQRQDSENAYAYCSSSSNSYLSNSSLPSSTTSTPRTATPSDLDHKYSSPASSVGSSPVAHNAALPKPITANGGPVANGAPLKPANSNNTTPTSQAQAQAPPSAWSKPRSLNLLKPFKRSSAASSSGSGSSSYSLTPTPSIDNTPKDKKKTGISPEEILTLGTINLFRTTSKDNRENESTGWGLSRWTSAGGGDASGNGLLAGSSPLARTQSTQSYKKKSKSMSLFGSNSGSSSSLSDSKPKRSSTISGTSSASTAPAPTPGGSRAPRHKGARMLNGRIYGAKRSNANPNHNPFANARDEDDEFVEWGYGGMGSVKGARSAGVGNGGVNWARLQGAAEAVGPAGGTKDGVGGEEKGRVQRPKEEDDGDDGSGLAWVRKRREERERKAKEAKEKEAKEAAAAAAATTAENAEESTSAMSTPTPTRSSTMEGGISATLAGQPPFSDTFSEEPISAEMDLDSDVGSEKREDAKGRQEDGEEGGIKVDEQDAGEARGDADAGADAVAREEDETDEEMEEGQHTNGVPTPNASVLNAAAVFGFGMTPIEGPAPPSSSSPPSATPPVPFPGARRDEHVLRAVNVPMPGQRRMHSHSLSLVGHRRTSSKGSVVLEKEGTPRDEKVDVGTPTDVPAVPRTPSFQTTASTPTGAASASGNGPSATTRPRSSSESSTDSEADDDSDDSDSEQDDEDEEDEEEEGEDERRKTALGAGVEKISRHKEQA